MSAEDVPAGWYRRAGEPGMLTWWDGSHWTDRRTPIPGGPLDPAAVIRPVTDEGAPPGDLGDDAQRPGHNSGPIPVIGGAPDDSSDAVFADPTSVFEPVGRNAWTPDDDRIDGAFQGSVEAASDRRRRPRVWLVGLPLLLIALVAGTLVLTSDSDDGDGDEAGDDTGQLTTMGEAVEIAEEAGLPIDLPESTVGSLIEDICDTAAGDGSEASLALRIAQLPLAVDQVDELLKALGKGAAARCPEDIAGDSGLLLRTGELATGSISGSDTTLPTATTQVTAPTTQPTAPSVTSTTKKPATSTTKKPSPTTSAPTTLAPTTTAPCNANYAKCLNSASDYDCVGDSDDADWSGAAGDQDGPNFVSGPFAVTGSDQFGLDKNGNGIACEKVAQT